MAYKVGAAIVVLVIVTVELPGVLQETKNALENLSSKISSMDTDFKDVSKFEILVINYLRYNVLSTDFERISKELKTRHRLSLTKHRGIKLTDTVTIRNRQHRHVTEKLEGFTQHVIPSSAAIRRSIAARPVAGDSDDEEIRGEAEAVSGLVSRSFDEEAEF